MIRRVHAARAIADAADQEREDVDRERRVILGAPCHSVDLAVEELVLRRAVSLERDVLRVPS